MVKITTFYKFDNISSDEVHRRATVLKNLSQKLNIRGLVILGTEGFNLTVSGKEIDLQEFKQQFYEWGYTDLLMKDSEAQKHPFRLFKVQIRKEIVTLGAEVEVPKMSSNHHLSTEEFHKAMQEDDVVVIDTRNWYETDIGKFKKALDFRIKEFSEFPKKIQGANIPKDKKVLIYCTGGIRCEKAIEDMKKQGYDNVYQLEGGILKYFEDISHGDFEGECFVFDHRVAVDQKLQPSQKFRLCPHCGQPGTLKIECVRCDHPAVICVSCSKQEYYKTCSKNCAHQVKLRPGKKGPHQEESASFN